MKTEIKPCEHCGGVGMMMILSESDRKSYAVECLECWHYSNRKFLTEEQAIKYWNDGSQDGYDLVRPPEVEE